MLLICGGGGVVVVDGLAYFSSFNVYADKKKPPFTFLKITL